MPSEPAPGATPPLHPLLRAFLTVGLGFFAVGTLYLAARVLVPVVEALVVWFILNALANGVRRVPVVGRSVPRPIALGAVALAAFAVGVIVVERAVGTATAIGTGGTGLQQALDPIFGRAATVLGIPSAELVDHVVDGLGIEALLRQIVAAVVGIVNHFGIVAIYVAFLLIDQQFFDAKLNALVPDPVRRAQIRALLGRIAAGIQAYLWIMTLMSALTSGLSYVILRLMHVEHAGFLTTAIFFLNFIPTIGSILGTILPAAFALLQFQQLGPALLVLVAIGAVQFVVGNVLLPRFAGSALNISLTVTIFSLFAWGALWGVTGMFVAMPLTAMLIITFSNFSATRPFAVALSRTGEVEPPTAG